MMIFTIFFLNPELLAKSESSKLEAEKEVSRVREELAQASTAALTSSHEAANLKQQLAVRN